ncbi:unnamed protein product [Allacma fusca]|uniref:separase n=1 Tax=Allacma fusca TaxID=39272 RepID=A0A8J2K546_9HEXA|nr:unnamed protein product [Allacma fusca]
MSARSDPENVLRDNTVNDETSPTKSNDLDNPGTSPTTDRRVNGGFKLDLPLVYNNLKYGNFRGTTRVSFLVTKSRRRDLADSLADLTLKEKNSGFGGSSNKTPAIDKSLEAIRSKKPKKETVFRSCRLNDDSGNRKTKVEKDPVWQKLVKIFNWARSHTATSQEEIIRMTDDWRDYMEGHKTTTLGEIADLFSVSAGTLQDFQLDESLDVKLSTVIQKLRHLVSHLVYPDLLKMQAFREWQSDRGSMSKCAYYLSESHGTHLRSDIIDKHCLFFCKKEELAKAESNITALTFSNNRFGSDAVDYRATPPLFLSSFTHLHGDEKRSSFVSYVRQPEIEPSSRVLHGILEEFRKVMAKNRHINDEYHGCRKKYWDIRAEHNKHLSDILDAIEDSWLAPFSLLLPGNIKDVTIQSKIVNKLADIQSAAGIKITAQARVFLYKLMENYGLISSKIKFRLKEILAEFLQISVKRASAVADIVIKVTEEIPEDQERWPTVLILDSELEQLPWDWLPSLRTTSVTRMASVAAIYSSMRVMHLSRPKYPEIVDTRKCTFILNPDQSLMNVQKRLESYLKSHKMWKGIISRKPTFQEMEDALQNKDVMLYCGHGSGINFFPDFALQKLLCNATPILMGCSSAQYRYQGPKANSSSIVTSYLIAACPSIVGFLWEVTDVECDRVTVDMLQRWLPGPKKLPTFPHFDPKLNRPREKCLATAMLRSRKAATQFLTEAALVNYGLPIETK